LNNGCDITAGSPNGESVFVKIILLIQQSLELTEDVPRMGSLQVLLDILISLPAHETAVRKTMNNTGARLGSPLHLWASIVLKSSEDYANRVTEEHTFEDILRIIFSHLLECGANVNLRNVNEETPLHVCGTWTAAKLLLDAGANPKDVDSSGNSPLLAAAKKKYSENTNCFYPDFTQDPETFWTSILENRLDPWVADKQAECILSILLKSKSFVPANALVKAACQETNHVGNEIKISLLNAICKDESMDTHWKYNLVTEILSSFGRTKPDVESPLRLCCLNIGKFGLFNDNPYSIQQNENVETSHDDGQPPPKKPKIDESRSEGGGKEKANGERQSDYSVHARIAKQLLLCKPDINLRDSDGVSCVDIADNCPDLLDFLRKPIETNTLPILIPWTSVSRKLNLKLAKVARGLEYKEINEIWYHESPIGKGASACVFAGINPKDGREVCVKRLAKFHMQRAEDIREIRNLASLVNCEHIVRYFYFYENDDFSFIILELMDGNLEEFLSASRIDAIQATLLCKDVLIGLDFLHKQNILHRDLKPHNILYKEHPIRCLKIADFGLSRKDGSEGSTVYGSHAGTRCWIAPEVLTLKTNSVDKDCFGPASDVFSCGMIIHYIFSPLKHPFSPTDKMGLCHEIETNIVQDRMEGWDDSLSPEATHLVKGMLKSNKDQRLSAQKALKHPLFWSNEKKMHFLQAVGNQEVFQCPRSRRPPTLTKVETDLEGSFGAIVKYGSWDSSRYKYMPDIHTEMTKGTGGGRGRGRGRRRRPYVTNSVVELVRFVRNVYQHYNDNSFPTAVSIEQLLFTDFVFLEYFPDLVMEVYHVIKDNCWDNLSDIKSAMNE
jgi:serine/threonine protein kinase